MRKRSLANETSRLRKTNGIRNISKPSEISKTNEISKVSKSSDTSRTNEIYMYV